jgi:hypothetical protein
MEIDVLVGEAPESRGGNQLADSPGTQATSVIS